MFEAIRLIAIDPRIRGTSIGVFLVGIAFASAQPYMSILGINELGMSDGAFATMLMVGSFVSLTSGILMGVLSDMVRDRRSLLMVQAALGASGYLFFYFLPDVRVYVGVFLLVQPFVGALVSGQFAAVRAAASELEGAQAVVVNANVRSLVAFAWILTPGIVGYFLAGAQSVSGSWAAAGVAIAFSGLSLLLLTPPIPNKAVETNKLQQLTNALRAMTSLQIVMRVLAIACLTGVQSLSNTLYPLLITGKLGGTTTNVGFVAGATAAAEIPFMLLWGWAASRFSNKNVLLASGVVFSAYLAGLGLSESLWQVYLLIPVSAAGAAAILSIPLSYMQDFFEGKPGLAASLMSLLYFLSTWINSGSFAFGTSISDYSGTALLAAGIALSGCIILGALERSQAVSA